MKNSMVPSLQRVFSWCTPGMIGNNFVFMFRYIWIKPKYLNQVLKSELNCDIWTEFYFNRNCVWTVVLRSQGWEILLLAFNIPGYLRPTDQWQTVHMTKCLCWHSAQSHWIIWNLLMNADSLPDGDVVSWMFDFSLSNKSWFFVA